MTTSTERPLNVLFLCTHNSARSILAEALLTALGRGRFVGYSAGSHPGTAPNPLALQALAEAGIATKDLHSKSWDVYGRPDAPRMDLVITVCDNAAGEVCPYWPGQPATAHWGYEDPSTTQGAPEARLQAFKQTMLAIRRRIELLVNLPDSALSRLAIGDSARRLATGA